MSNRLWRRTSSSCVQLWWWDCDGQALISISSLTHWMLSGRSNYIPTIVAEEPKNCFFDLPQPPDDVAEDKVSFHRVRAQRRLQLGSWLDTVEALWCITHLLISVVCSPLTSFTGGPLLFIPNCSPFITSEAKGLCCHKKKKNKQRRFSHRRFMTFITQRRVRNDEFLSDF